MTAPIPDETPCPLLTPKRAGLPAVRRALASSSDGCVGCDYTGGLHFGGAYVTCHGCYTPEITDPREAWEILATRGPIPAGWVSDPRRAFAHDGIDVLCAACEGAAEVIRAYSADDAMACDECEGRGVIGVHHDPIAHPPTVSACAALASDVAGIAQAEAFAREAVARLARYGAPQPERIVWRVGAWDVQASAWGPRKVDPGFVEL